MKSILSILATLLLAAPAFATGNHHTPPPPKPTPAPQSQSASESSAVGVGVGVGIAGAKSNSSSKATGGNASAKGGSATSISKGGAGGQGGKGGSANAAQGQQQVASSDQSQGQNQNAISDQSQEQSANNEGVQQGVEFNQTYKQVKQVQTAVAGNALGTTADCRVGGGAGAQGASFGLSFGGARKDHDCARLVLANNLYARGQKVAGDRVFCQITEIKQALGDDCIALINEQQVSYDVEVERRKERVGFPANK